MDHSREKINNSLVNNIPAEKEPNLSSKFSRVNLTDDLSFEEEEDVNKIVRIDLDIVKRLMHSYYNDTLRRILAGSLKFD